MKEYGWVVIVVIMLATIIILQGCTRFQTKDAASKEWNVTVDGQPEECKVTINVYSDDEISDDTIELKNVTPRVGS